MNFWTISTVGVSHNSFFFYFRTLNLKEMTRSSKKILILGISNWSKHHFAPISSCATILFSIFIDQMAWQFSIFHTAWQNDKTPAPNLLSTTEEVCSIADVSLFFNIGSISWKVATFHSMEYHTDVRPLSNIGVIFELPVKREISSPTFCGFGQSRPRKILLYLTCSCSHLTADIFLAIDFTMHCLLLYITDMYSSISFC